MIKLEKKSDCCGCAACVQRCPKQCISMQEDEEGFLYPAVDKESCIDCGLCEKVCPILSPSSPHLPHYIYAAKSKDEHIRKHSSLGGVFTLLAEQTINAGGVVFGARFDEKWDVVHDYSETLEGLSAFRGSKYVQSSIGQSYKQVESFLRGGRLVLFSGTPCQIAGLKRFLRKDYENLTTVDFICHGVPSPKVWRMYLKETVARQCEKNTVSPHPISGKNALVEGILFRDKCLGWKKFSFALTLSTTLGSGEKNSVLLSEPIDKNIFMRGFMSNLFFRPSCHFCAYRELRSGSDITLADCWGIHHVYPDFDDDKGISLCIVKSDKFKNLSSSLECLPVDLDFVRQYNHSCFESDSIPLHRQAFFNAIQEDKACKYILKYATYPDKSMRAIISRMLDRIGMKNFIKKCIGKI